MCTTLTWKLLKMPILRFNATDAKPNAYGKYVEYRIYDQAEADVGILLEWIEKALEDSESGVIPAAHIQKGERLMRAIPPVRYVMDPKELAAFKMVGARSIERGRDTQPGEDIKPSIWDIAKAVGKSVFGLVWISTFMPVAMIALLLSFTVSLSNDNVGDYMIERTFYYWVGWLQDE